MPLAALLAAAIAAGPRPPATSSWRAAAPRACSVAVRDIYRALGVEPFVEVPALRPPARRAQRAAMGDGGAP